MILASLRIAIRALLAQRLRSALTALGILIGTAAVVVVVALGYRSARTNRRRNCQHW